MPAWEQERSLMFPASREAIWAVWSDAEHWADWNSGVRSASLDGPFAAGTNGRLRPASGPTGSIEIVELEPNVCWITITRLPGAQFQLEHRIDDGEAGQMKVTYRGRLTGRLAPLYVRVRGRALTAAVEAVHELLARVTTISA
jgi:uncharacterized protein YndB with AHSA1/START domain